MGDGEIHKGPILQLKTGIGKKWSRRYGLLYDRSPKGIRRLELSEPKEKSRKVINLEKCANMCREQFQEGKKNLYAIRINNTDDKTPLIFAWETSEDCEIWSNKFSQVLFGVTDTNTSAGFNQGTYEVEIRPNEMTEKLKLKGTYILSVTVDYIELLHKQSYQLVMKWPLHFLRKYGRDKQVFSLEAGRRCLSGEGMFYFKTDQYNAIFQDVEHNVKALAKRTRAASTSSANINLASSGFLTPNTPSLPPSPPDSPRAPIPTPVQKSNLYDNPLDARQDNLQQQSLEATYSYDEPINHKSPKIRKQMFPKKDATTSSSSSSGQRSKPKPTARSSKGQPPTPAPPPPPRPNSYVDSDPTYAVATDLMPTPSSVADDHNISGDYSRLSMAEMRRQLSTSTSPHQQFKSQQSVESEYDSLTWSNGASGNQQVASQPPPNSQDYMSALEVGCGGGEYATADSFSSTTYQSATDVEDATYDQIQR